MNHLVKAADEIGVQAHNIVSRLEAINMHLCGMSPPPRDLRPASPETPSEAVIPMIDREQRYTLEKFARICELLDHLEGVIEVPGVAIALGTR